MRVCPCVPPLGCKQRLLGHTQGTCPGIPSQARGTRVSSVGWGAAGHSQPGTGLATLGLVLALLQGAERGPRQRGGGLSAQRCGWPRGQWELRGVGGSVSSGHEDAWSDGAHPGTETLMRERGPAGPRHGRASGGDGGDGAGGTRQGCPCPARAFVHGWRSVVPAPPGAEVLQSN